MHSALSLATRVHEDYEEMYFVNNFMHLILQHQQQQHHRRHQGDECEENNECHEQGHLQMRQDIIMFPSKDGMSTNMYE